MTEARLQQATLTTMVRLVSPAGAGELEAGRVRPGDEQTTPVTKLAGRNGYDASFLNGWSIPMPRATGAAEADMRELRRGGNGVELTYRNFSVIMSTSRRLPIITAANIDGSQSRRVARVSTWKYDGRLDPDDQWGEALYFDNPLDRGHMVRREDPIWGTIELAKQANVDTFHYTNACPQVATVNQGVWVGLEDFVLDHARLDGMKVNVYTGPYFSDQDVRHSSGAMIPLAFWKVVAIVTEDGRKSATAYEVSQQTELGEGAFVFGAYKTFQISIQQVLGRTNVDFSALVPFDGFSGEERATGQPMRVLIERPEDVRL